MLQDGGDTLEKVINFKKVKVAIDHYSKLQNLTQGAVSGTFCEVLESSLRDLGYDLQVTLLNQQLVLNDLNQTEVSTEDVHIQDPYNFIHKVNQDLQAKLREVKLSVLQSGKFDKNLLIDVVVLKKLRSSLIGSYFNQEVLMSDHDMVFIDRIREGMQVKVMIKQVTLNRGHIKIIATRRGKEFVQLLLKEMVPEVREGTIKVAHIFRHEGVKTYVLLEGSGEIQNPIKVCVGIKATRSREIKRYLTEQVDFKMVPQVDTREALETFCEEIFKEHLVSIHKDVVYIRRGERFDDLPHLEFEMINNLWGTNLTAKFVSSSTDED